MAGGHLGSQGLDYIPDLVVQAGDSAVELVVQRVLDLLLVNDGPCALLQLGPVQLRWQLQDQQPQLFDVVHHDAELGEAGSAVGGPTFPLVHSPTSSIPLLTSILILISFPIPIVILISIPIPILIINSFPIPVPILLPLLTPFPSCFSRVMAIRDQLVPTTSGYSASRLHFYAKTTAKSFLSLSGGPWPHTNPVGSFALILLSE